MKHSICEQSAYAFLIVALLAACSGGGVSEETNSTPPPPPAVGPAFDVPSDRRITWSAGLDPVGGIPDYPSVLCGGLDKLGREDATAKINTCIETAAPNTAVFIPAGKYLVLGEIKMKSNVALRGAKASVSPWLPLPDSTETTLDLKASGVDSGGSIVFNGGTRSENWPPPEGRNSGTAITGGYEQGSTSITVNNATGYAVNDVISIYQDKDPGVIDDGGRVWLGEDCGDIGCLDSHVFAQYAVVTAMNGTTLTIKPPIYYVTPNHTGESIRKQKFNVVKAGLENLRIEGIGTTPNPNIAIYLAFTQNCWIKGVDSYNNGGSGLPHVYTIFSFQNEYRDSYLHTGRSNDSGSNYGFQQYNWNSQHKIENNIVRDTRHAIIFEGGGSGNAILYNYMDDNWESVAGLPTTHDSSFLSEDAVANHGAHPYMNLWEGNFSANFWGDYTQGSSSHNTAFRNYFQCKNTTLTLSSPWAWVCVEIEKYNRYYNLVGNVIGYPDLAPTNGTLHGTLLCNSNPIDPRSTSCDGVLPVIYRFGYGSIGGSGLEDPEAFSTAIIHGNFDYVTDTVAHWEVGELHTLPNSLYYASKPAFFGSHAWPPFGSDLSPKVGALPAKDRYCNKAQPPCPSD